MPPVAPRKKLPRDQITFIGRTGEELWKKHGDLEGSDFMMNKLEDCQVHILDHTA